MAECEAAEMISDIIVRTTAWPKQLPFFMNSTPENGVWIWKSKKDALIGGSQTLFWDFVILWNFAKLLSSCCF